MRKYIYIKSTDGTDTIIFLDKIQYISQTRNGCDIRFDNGGCLHTTSSFEVVLEAITVLYGDYKMEGGTE